MGVDWPTVFSGTKTVLDPLSHAAWPIAFAGVAYGFRDPLTKLIGRIKTVSGWGASLDLAPKDEAIANQQDNEQAQLPAAIELTALPPADAVLDILDNDLRQKLAAIQGNDELKLAWAIRMRSISEINRLHEFHYRVLFGSQIKALVSLNQVGEAEVDPFRRFYEEQVMIDPANAIIHRNRTFDDWGQFLVTIGYVERVADTDPQIVRITPFGRQFCAWLGYAGASQIKPG